MADRTLQVGVKVLLNDGTGRYLVLRRSPQKYPEVEQPWDIPGGRIDPGSPLLDNLRREVHEEAGLEITGEPRLIMAQDILRIPERHVVRLTYVAEVDATEVTLSEDHTESAWLKPDELLQLEGLDSYANQAIETLG